MARNNATIGINVEAKTSGAQRAFDKLTASVDKSKRSTHEFDKRLSAFGKALQKAERANQSAARSSEKQTGALDRMQGSLSSAAGRVQALTAVLGGAGLVAAGAAAVQKIGELAAESGAAQGAFNKLQIGIEKAKAATGRLIGDMDLATRANQAASLGVAKTSGEFAELARAAQILGEKLGTGTLPALDSLIGAVGRGSTLLLDNLGIAITEVTRREKEMAAQMGKTTSQLTAQEKQGNRQKAMLAAISDAVKNAELNHDGLAASITRVGVAFEDLKTRALGGGGGRSVFDALKDLEAEELISLKKLTKEARVHGAARAELAEILENHGSRLGSLSELTNALFRAESDLAGGSAELAAKQNAQAREAEEFRRLELDAVRDSLTSLTQELQIAEAKGAKEEEILALKMLQTQTQADLLELEGKTKEATDKRFEAELDEIRLQNFKPKRKGGSRQRNLAETLTSDSALRKMRKEDLRSDPEFVEDRDALMQEMLAAAGLVDFRGTIKIGFREALEDARRSDKELGIAKEETRVSRSLRGIDSAQDENATRDATIKDRIDRAQSLVDRERDVLLSHIDFLEENTNDAAELERLRSEREQVHHDMRMKRIAAEKKARQDSFRSMMSGIQVASNAQQLAANVGNLAVEASIRGEKRKARAMNIAAGTVAAVQAALETARSIAAFATLNIPQGIAHAAAAAAFVTASVTAFREAGGGGGRGRTGGGIPQDFGIYGGSGGAGTGSVAPFGDGDIPSAPISEQAGPTRNQLNLSQAASASGGGSPGARGSVVVNFNGPMLGRPTEQQLVDLKRDMDRATKTVGAA